MADIHPPLLWVRAGRVPYERAYAWQRGLVELRHAGVIEDVVLTLEHPAVYTAGRHADVEAHVLAAGLPGARADIPLVRTDRGGDVTYHGPGQLVAYPIVRLRDGKSARKHVRGLERAIIDVLEAYGLEGVPGEDLHRPGVWVGGDKVAAIGVRVSGGVSSHGLALNVNPDLEHFSGIVPCGITDAGVTSLRALGVTATLEEIAERLVPALGEALGRDARAATEEELSTLVPEPDPRDLASWSA